MRIWGLVLFIWLPSLCLGTTASDLQQRLLENLSREPCGSGDWGSLSCQRIVIAPTNDVLEEILPSYPAPNVWYFWNVSARDLEQLWKKFSLTGLSWDALRRSAVFNSNINGFVVKPDGPTIASLSENQRTKLYNYLADNSLNFLQADAFRFPGQSRTEWLGKDIDNDVRNIVKKLIYRDGDTLFISDINQIFSQVIKREDRISVLKAISRQPSYLIRVKISPGSDVTSLSKYWSVGRRRKDVYPILDSLADVPGGERIDAAHLLPHFARSRLYTYPTINRDILEATRDCFWTALNFFSDRPDDRMSDIDFSTAVLKKDYTVVTGAPQLGDILVYGNREKGAFHAAVYIAGGFVFTKNGTRVSSPWLFMTMAEMKNFYAQFENAKIVVYRKKE